MREVSLFAVSLLVPALACAQPATAREAATAPAPVLTTAVIPLPDVRQIVDALAPNIPPQFLGAGAPNWDDAWAQWRRGHETRVRERLDRGDEDSVINWWVFGTSFTRLPPARARDLARDGRYTLDEVLARRLDDLLDALTSSRLDERLAFVREFLESRRIDLSTAGGRQAARRLLTEGRARVRDEFVHTDAMLAAVKQRGDRTAQLETASTIFRERGLSSDTSLLVDAAIDSALHAMRDAGLVRADGIRRVAIVGPGLDFINKADGHDFYPLQTIQPFAVIDSLLRHGLSTVRDLHVTTIDVSRPVIKHLSAARDGARRGEGYLLHLPLTRTERWTDQIRTFWREIGDRIGTAAKPVRAPDTDSADVRAIRVRPDVVALLDPPVEADIVTSRLDVSGKELFDLIVATNVFVYYTPFEQALAATNIAAMLGPGGVLLSNNDVPAIPAMKSSVGHLLVAYSDRQSDNIFAYQRR